MWDVASNLAVRAMSDAAYEEAAKFALMMDPDKVRRLGEKYGYPTCCIDQFCDDIRAGRPPYLTRGARLISPSGEGGYVPCDSCLTRGRASGIIEV